MSRECHSCGSRSTDTAFPGARKPFKQPDRCCDCATDASRGAVAALDRATAERFGAAAPLRRSIITRASYRAAYQYRQQSPQLDMVDLIVGKP